MSETEISVNVTETGGWTDDLPLLILGFCLVIAVIAFLLGLSWLKRRRTVHEHDHLVVDIAEPETLRDLPEDRRP